MNSKNSSLAEHYASRGVTEIVDVFREADLLPIREIIYKHTRHLIVDHNDSLPMSDKLSLGLKVEPEDDDVRRVVAAVNESDELRKLIDSEPVKVLFRQLFQSEDVFPFAISKFRAQFPTIEKTALNWHQDQGSWYAVTAKELAQKLPAILWLSFNGATKDNSIEIIPNSHKSRLGNHFFVARQGYFNTDVPKRYQSIPTCKVECAAGQGIMFHPLTYHRSIRSEYNRPRYSIDIRFYDENSDEKYRAHWKLKLKRLFTETHP